MFLHSFSLGRTGYAYLKSLRVALKYGNELFRGLEINRLVEVFELLIFAEF